MRSAVWDHAAASISAELLTTGEVATLLGVSRQHVVDLCNQGDLEVAATSGTHRRIARSEVEAFAASTKRMSRDQRRSLWLSHAIAGHLVREPEDGLARARETLAHLQSRHTRGQAARWLREWERLLAGPLDDLLRALTSSSPRSRELRQNNPFASLLDEPTRATVLAAFAERDARR